MHKRKIHYGFVIALGLLLAMLVGTTGYYLVYQMRTASTVVMVQQVAAIERALKRIDETCEIISIAHERSYIDFLVVRTFVGSQVGPLQLRFPAKWEGPYEQQNPTVQGIQFELVTVRDGYAIVPGAGVTLMNGKIVGKDIMFGPDTDIDALLVPESGLEFEGNPLVRKIALKKASIEAPAIVQQGEAA